MARTAFGKTFLTQQVAQFTGDFNKNLQEEMTNIYASPWEQARLSEQRRQQNQSRNIFRDFLKASSPRSTGSTDIGALASMQFGPSAIPETPPELELGGMGGLARLFSGFRDQGQEIPEREFEGMAPGQPRFTRGMAPPAISAPPRPGEPVDTPTPVPTMTPTPSPTSTQFRRGEPDPLPFSRFEEDLVAINEALVTEEKKARHRRDSVDSLMDEISDMGEDAHRRYAPTIEDLVTRHAPESLKRYTLDLLSSQTGEGWSSLTAERPNKYEDYLEDRNESGWDREQALGKRLGLSTMDPTEDPVERFDSFMSLWSSGKDWMTNQVANEQGVSLQSRNAQKIWNNAEAQKRDQYDIQILNGTYVGDYGSYLRDKKLWTPEEHDFQVSLLLEPAMKNGLLDLWTEKTEAILESDNRLQVFHDENPEYRKGNASDAIKEEGEALEQYQERLNQEQLDSPMGELTRYFTSHPFRVVDLMKYKATAGKTGRDKGFYERNIPRYAYDWMTKNTDLSDVMPGTVTLPLDTETQEDIKQRAGWGLFREYVKNGYTTDFIFGENLPGSLRRSAEAPVIPRVTEALGQFRSKQQRELSEPREPEVIPLDRDPVLEGP